MTVSLIVGALRMLAEQTKTPSTILRGFNRKLAVRGSEFTTCLIALLSHGKDGLLANAGHRHRIAREKRIDTLSNLPLGRNVDAHYIDSLLVLRLNDRLTLVFDGAVTKTSGRNSSDLTALASTAHNRANTIASAAPESDQEDDNIVLTFGYLPTVPRV